MSADALPPNEVSPRPLTRAAALVLQLVGGIFTFAGCCIWSFAGLSHDKLPASQPALRNLLSAPVLGLAAICVTFVGGLALSACGLGLLAERRRAGHGSVAVTVIGTLFWVIYVGWAIVNVSIARIIFGVILTVCWAGCLGLSLLAADELKRFPPPPGPNLAPPDLKLDRATDRERPRDLRDEKLD